MLKISVPSRLGSTRSRGREGWGGRKKERKTCPSRGEEGGGVGGKGRGGPPPEGEGAISFRGNRLIG